MSDTEHTPRYRCAKCDGEGCAVCNFEGLEPLPAEEGGRSTRDEVDALRAVIEAAQNECKRSEGQRPVTLEIVETPEPADIDAAVAHYVRTALAQIGFPASSHRTAA